MEGDSHCMVCSQSAQGSVLGMAQAGLKDTRAAGDAENSEGSSLAAGKARALLCLGSTAAEELPG